MASITISASIPFGTHARIGYRLKSSSDPFTYDPVNYPAYNEFPFTISGLALGTYEVEVTTVCPNCSGGIYSEPVIVDAVSE